MVIDSRHILPRSTQSTQLSTLTTMEPMSRVPDYHSYTLKELYSVARAIDREEFPDRYALVIQEIRRREGIVPPMVERRRGLFGRRRPAA